LEPGPDSGGDPPPARCCPHEVDCDVHNRPHDAQFIECSCAVGVGSIRHEYRLARDRFDIVGEVLAVTREANPQSEAEWDAVRRRLDDHFGGRIYYFKKLS
jgi:hypothetical protein